MVKHLSLFGFVFVFSSITFPHSSSISPTLQPRPLKSFDPKNIQVWSYQISISFDMILIRIIQRICTQICHFLFTYYIFFPHKSQAAKSCPYELVIKTSCSSTTYTRDKISLAFGDSYGNEVSMKPSLLYEI
jgi:hypothetical protein